MQIVFGKVPINELVYVRSITSKQKDRSVIVALLIIAGGLAGVCFYLHRQNQRKKKQLAILKNEESQH